MHKFDLLLKSFGPERIKLNEQLKYHTATKVGGPAECFYIATSEKELVKILETALQLKLPYFVFGAGTKIYISEKGLEGLVIKNRSSAIKISGIKGKVGKFGLGVDEVMIEVESGVTILQLNEFLKKQNLHEVAGISSPFSSIGGAVFLDPTIQELVQKIEVWEDGELSETDVLNLKRNKHIVLSLILKIKSKF